MNPTGRPRQHIPGFVYKPNHCWEWRGAKTNEGYGLVYINNKTIGAHRYVYELVRAPIAPGLTIDHLCRNPGCVNPAHLEPITMRENLLRGFGPPAMNARKTHCKNGHEFTPENIGWHGPGRTKRHCKACRKSYNAIYHATSP